MHGALHHGLVVGKHVAVVGGGGTLAVEVGQALVGGEGSGHRVETSARLAVAQLGLLVLGEELLLLLLVVVELAAAEVVLELLLLLICFVVVVRAGAAAAEEVGASAVGISSKERGRRDCVVASAVAEILIAERLAVKCIGRGGVHLISTVGNTIQVVPLELLLRLWLLLREGGRQAALAHGRRRAAAREGRPVDRVAEVAPLAAHHRVLLDVAVRAQPVVLRAIVQEEVDVVVLRQLGKLQPEVVRRRQVVHQVEHVAPAQHQLALLGRFGHLWLVHFHHLFTALLLRRSAAAAFALG